MVTNVTRSKGTKAFKYFIMCLTSKCQRLNKVIQPCNHVRGAKVCTEINLIFKQTDQQYSVEMPINHLSLELRINIYKDGLCSPITRPAI